MYKLLIVSPWYIGISGPIDKQEREDILKYKHINVHEYVIYDGSN